MAGFGAQVFGKSAGGSLTGKINALSMGGQAVGSGGLPSARQAALRQPSGTGSDPLGLELPPEAGEALEVALIVFGAMLLAGVLFANELHLGARYRDLRSRFTHRYPS
jgi:hypothetical protein